MATAALLVVATSDAAGDSGTDSSLDWVPLIESAVNDLIFVGLAVYFLFNFPERLERGHLLDLLHRLRSLAHVIDMHQLTKDPERLKQTFRQTSASPGRAPRPCRDGENYLDYCSELLSLTGKAAALCAEKSRGSWCWSTVSHPGSPDQRHVTQDLAEDPAASTRVIQPCGDGPHIPLVT